MSHIRASLVALAVLSFAGCADMGAIEGDTFEVGEVEENLDGTCTPLTLNATGAWYPDGFMVFIDGRATNCTSRKTRVSLELVATDPAGQVVSLGGYSRITGSWRLEPGTGVTYFTSRTVDMAPGDLTLTATSNQGTVLRATIAVPPRP
jgi:hypothetical protein